MIHAILLFLLAATWLGPDGRPLPFASHDEVAEFLRQSKAVEVSRTRLKGITKPRKIVVESGGVRANAVFRTVNEVHHNARWDDGRFTAFLRDSYRNEVAAYELSLLLGLDNVPPAVIWKLRGEQGSLQIFIENAQPGYDPKEGRRPADPKRWLMERAKMRVFDALIENIDRNVGNMLIDSNGKVWWIDHTRSFGRKRVLDNPELITRCERRLFERLKAVDPQTIAERMKPHMTLREINALLERRLKLFALIEQRIAEHGEAAVLFTLEGD